MKNKKIKKLTDRQIQTKVGECIYRLGLDLSKQFKNEDAAYIQYLVFSTITGISSDVFCKKHLTKIFKEAIADWK